MAPISPGPSPIPLCPLALTTTTITGSLDQIRMKETSLPLESREKKEMNTSISVSLRHIKADYLWNLRDIL